MQLFPSIVEEIAFWIIYLVAIIGPVIFFVRWERRNNASAQRPSKDPSGWLNTTIFPASLVAIWVGYARIAVLPGWFFYLGLTLFVVGMGFTVWAYHTLGRFFTLTVRVHTGQSVIDWGPYRFIRHPGYAGVFLAMLGLGLAVQSWVSVVILLLVSGFVLIYRVRIEEKFLVAELGNDYVEYCKRTKRIIPSIL